MTMPGQTLTLNIPEPLYHRLKHRAERSNRTVEDETVDILATVVPVADELPADLTDAISPLAFLDDAALWRAARSHLLPEESAQLEELHHRREREGLNETETQTLATLVRQYERAMLVRSQAAALLHQRGHDVSGLLSTP
jgi:plasmid stability protein